MQSQSSAYWSHQHIGHPWPWLPSWNTFWTHLPRIWISCPTYWSLLFSLLFWLLILHPLHAGEPQVLVFSLFSVHSHYLGNLILSYRQIQIKIPMTPQCLSIGLTSLNVSACLFQLSTCLHLRQFRLSTSKNELTFSWEPISQLIGSQSALTPAFSSRLVVTKSFQLLRAKILVRLLMPLFLFRVYFQPGNIPEPQNISRIQPISVSPLQPSCSAVHPNWANAVASFLFFKTYLCIFGYAGSLLLHGLFSSCGERGLLSSWGVRASHCFLLQWLLLLQNMDSRAQAQ